MSDYRTKLEAEVKTLKRLAKLLDALDESTRARVAAWVAETYGSAKKHA